MPQRKTKQIHKRKSFYDLKTVINRTPNSDTLLVLGDANAKVVNEDVYNEVSWKHMLHELSSRNGEMLLELALGNNLTVMSTQFQCKKIQKGTWLAPDKNDTNPNRSCTD